MNIRQKERIFFFFTYAITILSLFTYSVCDEKVKIIENLYTDVDFCSTITDFDTYIHSRVCLKS